MCNYLENIIVDGSQIFPDIDGYLATDKYMATNMDIVYNTLLSFAVDHNGVIYYTGRGTTPEGRSIPTLTKHHQFIAMMVRHALPHLNFIELTFTRRMYDALVFTVTQYDTTTDPKWT